MSLLFKKSFLLLFVILLPLQGFAAPFMALAHSGETLPTPEQMMGSSESAAAMPHCHDQHMAADGTAAHQDHAKLNCHENSPCCHIAALPSTAAVIDAARPEGHLIPSIRQAYADFLPEQPQRPPRLLPL
jgi:hypothetical protein